MLTKIQANEQKDRFLTLFATYIGNLITVSISHIATDEVIHLIGPMQLDGIDLVKTSHIKPPLDKRPNPDGGQYTPALIQHIFDGGIFDEETNKDNDGGDTLTTLEDIQGLGVVTDGIYMDVGQFRYTFRKAV